MTPMPKPRSPLLDAYDQSGVVTPSLQRALDLARQKMFQGGVSAPLTDQPGAGPSLGLTMPPANTPSLTQPQQKPVGGGLVPQPKPVSPVAAAHEQELSRLTTGDTAKTGIEKIKSPWLRTPLQVLDAIGSTFAPALTASLPGTQYHHQGLVQRARGNVEADQGAAESASKIGLQAAQTGEASALATKNSQPHIPTNELELWAQQNPAKPVSEFLKLRQQNAPEHVETPFSVWRTQNPVAPVVDYLKTEEGVKTHPPNEYSDFKTSYAKTHPNSSDEEMLAAFTKAKQPEQRAPQNEYEDFKKAFKLKNPGATDDMVVKEYAKAHQAPQQLPQSMMFIPDGKGGYTTTVVRPGDQVAPGAVTASTASSQNAPTSASRTVADQASAIRKTGDALIREIEAKKLKVGNIGSYWEQFVNGGPISDPDIAGLMTSLSSFAALQPKLHGFRSHDAMREFANIIGGVPKDAEALKASIRSIQNTAEIMERMGRIQTPGAAPAAGGPVRKFNPATGKLE